MAEDQEQEQPALVIDGSGRSKPADESAPQDAEPEQDDAKLTGDALHERAAELDIEGRGSMNADELRAAVAAAEAEEGGNGGQG